MTRGDLTPGGTFIHTSVTQPNLGKESAAFISGCQARSPGQRVLKTLKSLKGFRKAFLKAR